MSEGANPDPAEKDLVSSEGKDMSLVRPGGSRGERRTRMFHGSSRSSRSVKYVCWKNKML